MKFKKSESVLELNIILEQLSDVAISLDAKELALELRPNTNFIDVCRLIKETDDAYSLSERFGMPSFSELQNVNNYTARASSGGMLNMYELLTVAHTLRGLRTISEWYAHCSGIVNTLSDKFSSININRYIEDKIFTSIIGSEEMSDKASTELGDIRRKIRSKESSIRDKLDSMIHSPHYTKYLQEAIVTQRDGRFVLPVKSEARKDVPGLVHDTSSTGSTVFIEPVSVVDANNDIKVLRGKEREEINRILCEISEEVGRFSSSIKSSYSSAIELDLIFAKARLADKMKAIMPVINSDGRINLIKARHPLIDKKKVVPIDVCLGTDFDTLVITGPNTGGKTVTLKTIGLLSLMVMCGLLIPVSSGSEISIFDEIYVDIGDEQSISQSLSTFSSHMKNIISIIENVNDSSLVLIDELGAGTDPIEGAALAVSIIEELRKSKADLVVTTHYAELKAYAIDTRNVMNASCEFDVNTLSPTYRLILGTPGRSNAFAITKRLGMSENIVNRAQELVDSDSRDLESVIEKLEHERELLEDERKKAIKATESANRMRSKAQSEKDKIKTLKETEIEKAKAQADKIIRDTKRKSSKLLVELDKIKQNEDKSSTTEMAKKVRRTIRKKMGDIEEIVDPNEIAENWDYDYKLPREPKPGDAIIIRNIGEGEVLEVNDSGVLVRSGLLKTRVKLSDIMITDKKVVITKKNTQNVYRTTSKRDANFSTEVDLRGQSSEEAINNLQLFIDKCVLNGIDTIRVIHGKGLGVLRKAVDTELKTHPNVEEFRLGKYGEGEEGVTIVKLK